MPRRWQLIYRPGFYLVSSLYGSKINTSFAHRPTLIGGMRIKVGSDVYDGSLKGALAALEKNF